MFPVVIMSTGGQSIKRKELMNHVSLSRQSSPKEDVSDCVMV